MSVLRFERLRAAPGAADLLRTEAARAVDAIREADGALWAELAEGEDGLLLVSEWRRPADLDAWERSDAAVGFVRVRDPLLAEEPTLRRFGTP